MTEFKAPKNWNKDRGTGSVHGWTQPMLLTFSSVLEDGPTVGIFRVCIYDDCEAREEWEIAPMNEQSWRLVRRSGGRHRDHRDRTPDIGG